MIEETQEFDTEVTRQLVATDPFLAYTVIRHEREPEEHWLKQVFTLEVRQDPGLMTRYRNLCATREHSPLRAVGPRSLLSAEPTAGSQHI